MAKYECFEDLPVWQTAVRLYNVVLDLLETQGVPLSPGFRNQLDLAALSVANNIAEGFERSLGVRTRCVHVSVELWETESLAGFVERREVRGGEARFDQRESIESLQFCDVRDCGQGHSRIKRAVTESGQILQGFEMDARLRRLERMPDPQFLEAGEFRQRGHTFVLCRVCRPRDVS